MTREFQLFLKSYIGEKVYNFALKSCIDERVYNIASKLALMRGFATLFSKIALLKAFLCVPLVTIVQVKRACVESLPGMWRLSDMFNEKWWCKYFV